MRTFPVGEFSEERFSETLFAELMVVDERNPTVIALQPMPPTNRLMVVRKAAEYSVWPARKLDGSPDLRYNPLFVGGGDQWITLQELLQSLEETVALGDLFVASVTRAVPATITKWLNRGKLVDAAVLTSLSGWSLPLYFIGEYNMFVEAVERLKALREDITRGTCPSIITNFKA